MKMRASGRFLLVRLDFDLIDAMVKKSIIEFPQEVIEKLKGGCQISTVLSVGPGAFDDAPICEQQENFDWVGRQVVTARYPGHSVDFNPLLKDTEIASTILISCDEVHAIIAQEGEDGADV